MILGLGLMQFCLRASAIMACGLCLRAAAAFVSGLLRFVYGMFRFFISLGCYSFCLRAAVIFFSRVAVVLLSAAAVFFSWVVAVFAFWLLRYFSLGLLWFCSRAAAVASGPTRILLWAVVVSLVFFATRLRTVVLGPWTY